MQKKNPIQTKNLIIYLTLKTKKNMQPVFNQISLTHRQIELFNKIKTKGRYEQEKQYLFSGLYGNKALTKNEVGAWKQLENKLKSKIKN
jgi:hypothetical protein